MSPVRGHGVARVEDYRLLTGRGNFTDDMNPDGVLHCVFVRSPFPRASILGVDSVAAMALPGVIAVITGRDLADAGVGSIPVMPGFKRADGSTATYPVRNAIALDEVRFAGDPVAAVIARSQLQAQDAAEAVLVSYDELPAITDLTEATLASAPCLCPEAGSNVVTTTRHGDPAATDAAFRAAAHVISLEIRHQRLVPVALEPRATLASYDSDTDRITIWTGIQTPSRTRDGLANAVLKLPPAKIRLRVGDIGGGFGMKIAVFPEDAVLAFAARKLKAAVKWRADRSEEFLAGTHARALHSSVSLALDRGGRFLGLRVRSLADLGAYPGGPGPLVPSILGPQVVTGAYDIAHVDVRVDCVLTNTTPVGAYRGAGRPENILNIERLVDVAARELNIDPVELRKRNLVTKEQIPYRNAMSRTYDSGDFAKVMALAIENADWHGFQERKSRSASRGKLRGRGLSVFVEWTGGDAFGERVRVKVSPQGRITVWSATQAMGQGLETSYAQIAAERFGVALEAIRIVQGDTDVVGGFGSVGSRSLYVGGSAVDEGALRTIAAGRERAAEILEAASHDIDYANGYYRVAGTDRGISIFEIANREPGAELIVDAGYTVQGESWPNGCYVCEVEIDIETGQVAVDRFSAVDDVGNPVNPLIVAGQIHGGVAQGIGQALMEQAKYDTGSGQLLTGSLMDYCLPRADDLPPIAHELERSQPCLRNPLGAKGCGESGAIGAAPAVVNAVVDALAGYGVRHLDMPLTAERLHRILRREG